LPKRTRLDSELVRRGLATSRELARSLIAEGNVLVEGTVAQKASTLVSEATPIVVRGEGPFSRGAAKLAAALDALPVEVAGGVFVDVGASTGGFTHELLRRGARRVHAVDVGRNLLHESLRADRRVVAHEGLNARFMSFEDIGELCDGACVDVSFISATLIVPRLPEVLRPHAEVLILVKPQFEADRKEAARHRGVIRDPRIQLLAAQKVAMAMAEASMEPKAALPLPVAGHRNREIFLWGRLAEPGDLAGVAAGLAEALARGTE
jgi:23S rRNA (cytidine1920-2'-O)/16S rRNA (cytidine1409-2'-O)-methyltransferase